MLQGSERMKVYSPNEVAKLLELNTATLRKYSIILEKQGYNIGRNSQNHRYYQDKDIITLRRVITARKNGITLEEAIKNVVSMQQDNTYTNIINNGDDPNGNDIKELKEMVHKQNDLIKGLANKLDEQQEYINKRLNERDGALMQAMNEILETKKQLAIMHEKQGFFRRLFNKK